MAKPQQRRSEVAVSGQEIGLHLQGMSKFLDGVVEAIGFQQGAAEIVVRLSIGLKSGGALERRHGFGVAFKTEEGDAEAHDRMRQIREEHDHFLKRGKRFGVRASFQQHESQAELGGGVFGGEEHRLGDRANRLIQISLPSQGVGKMRKCFGVVGSKTKRVAVGDSFRSSSTGGDVTALRPGMHHLEMHPRRSEISADACRAYLARRSNSPPAQRRRQEKVAGSGTLEGAARNWLGDRA